MSDTQHNSYSEKNQFVTEAERLLNVCHICDTTFATPIELHRHTQTQCHKMMKTDSSVSNVKLEEQICTSGATIYNQGSDMNECSICKVKFVNSNDYFYHMVLHSEEAINVQKGTPTEAENKMAGQSMPAYRCEVCGKTFALKGNLSKHLIVHEGLKPFSCQICGKSFNLKGNRDKHMVTHSLEQPYECNICHKKFGLKGNLQKHTMTHSDSKCFKCTYCGKEFSLKGNLLKHLDRHKNGFTKCGVGDASSVNSVNNGSSGSEYNKKTGYIDLLLKVSEKIGVDITGTDKSATASDTIKDAL